MTSPFHFTPLYFSRTVIEAFAAAGFDTSGMVEIRTIPMPPRVFKLEDARDDFLTVRGRTIKYRARKWKKRR